MALRETDQPDFETRPRSLLHAAWILLLAAMLVPDVRIWAAEPTVSVKQALADPSGRT